MKLILGSQSKGRAKVLKDAGYNFSVMQSNIDEKSIRSDDYEELTLRIALAKAENILPHVASDKVLITADHVMVCDGKLREKPQSLNEAKDFLQSYSAHVAESISALVVTDVSTGLQKGGVEKARVFFKTIPDSIIDILLEKADVMNMSGALNIDDSLIVPYIDHIEGERDSVIGLPIKLLERLLSQLLNNRIK